MNNCNWRVLPLLTALLQSRQRMPQATVGLSAHSGEHDRPFRAFELILIKARFLSESMVGMSIE